MSYMASQCASKVKASKSSCKFKSPTFTSSFCQTAFAYLSPDRFRLQRTTKSSKFSNVRPSVFAEYVSVTVSLSFLSSLQFYL
jgi:hypothetical protein